MAIKMLISEYELHHRANKPKDCICPACWAGCLADVILDMNCSEDGELICSANELESESQKDMLFYNYMDEFARLNVDCEIMQRQIGNLMRRKAEVFNDFRILFTDLAENYENPNDKYDQERLINSFTGKQMYRSFVDLCHALWEQFHCPECNELWNPDMECKSCGHREGENEDGNG
jgi:hypothetical protein